MKVPKCALIAIFPPKVCYNMLHPKQCSVYIAVKPLMCARAWLRGQYSTR